MKNIFSFNSIIAKISECRRRMSAVRHEMLLRAETGGDTEIQKRELSNLNNEMSLLRSKLQGLRRGE